MNYYSILQVSQYATPEEIKRAYHKMARLFHPDNYQGSIQDAENQMAMINEAYAVLSDERKRREYDLRRKEAENSTEGTTRSTETYSDENINDRDKKNQNTTENNSFQTDKSNKQNYDKTVSNIEFVSKIMEGLLSIGKNLVEWIIILAIICVVVNHFGWSHKVKEFIKDINSTDFVMDKKMAPNDVVKDYFEKIRNGDSDGATNLFSNKYESKYSPLTIKQYHEIIAELYYGIDNKELWHPLFEQIRNFEYEIQNIESDEAKKQTKVMVHIQNYDVYSIETELENSDKLNDYLYGMTDMMLKNEIDKYGKSNMIEVNAIFVLEKENDTWKIDYVTPLRDFSSVVVGRADDLVMKLHDEYPDDENDDSVSEEDETEQSDIDSMLW